MNNYSSVSSFGVGNSGCCFSTLVILILILLQFNKRKGCGRGHGLVDNGILFIIALFYLSCSNTCNRIAC